MSTCTRDPVVLQPHQARKPSSSLWETVTGFVTGSFIASNIHATLFFDNCDMLGVKIITNIWLSYVSYGVLQLLF